LTGLKREATLGRRATDVVPNLRRAEFDWIGTYGRVALGGPSIRFEQFSEPLKRWYEVTVFSDQHGFFTTLFRDVTEHRHLQEVLRASELLLARSQEIAHVGSWSLDLTANHLTWSDETYRIFGLTPQEFDASYEAFLEAVHPEDRAAVNDAYTTSIREGRDSYEIEHRVVRRDTGETRYVYEKCVHERNEAGAIVRSVGMVQDITERKLSARALSESEERYRALFEFSMDAIALVSPGGLLLEANRAYLDLFGYTREDVGRLNVEGQYADEGARTAFLEWMAEHDAAMDQEVRLRKRDGTVMDCLRNVVVRRDSEGNVIGEQCVIRDITERRTAEHAIRASEQRFRGLFAQSMDAIYIVDYDGSNIRANPAWLRLLGYSAEELPQHNIIELYANPGDRQRLLDAIDRTGLYQDELRARKKDGTEFDCARTVTALRNEEGAIVGFQGIMRDITEQKRHRAELEHLAHFDALTGLANRRSISEKLDEWLLYARRYGGHLCVAMADIDHFKRVNDEHGHRIGDRVLAETARVLRGAIRATDGVGRYGGEEFLIILPGTDAAGAAVLAERLRSAVEGSPVRDAAGEPFSVTISLGVGEHADGDDQDSLVTRADTALYRAKAGGRNRVEVAAAPDASG